MSYNVVYLAQVTNKEFTYYKANTLDEVEDPYSLQTLNEVVVAEADMDIMLDRSNFNGDITNYLVDKASNVPRLGISDSNNLDWGNC